MVRKLNLPHALLWKKNLQKSNFCSASEVTQTKVREELSFIQHSFLMEKMQILQSICNPSPATSLE